MKKLKTQSIKVRMTEDEMAYYQQQAASYTSMSHYVRAAMKEYSNPNLKLQHELIPQIGEFYQKVHNELSWAGGNLNQAMKRTNELAAAKLLTPSFVEKVLFPVIVDTRDSIHQIQEQLGKLARIATKP